MKKIVIVTASIPPVFAGGGLRAYRYAQRLYKEKKLAFIFTERANLTIEEKFKISTITNKNMLPQEKILTFPSDNNKNKMRNQNKVKYFLPFIIWQFNLLYSLFWKIFQKRNSFKTMHCIGAGSWLNLYSVAMGKAFGKKTILEMTLLGSDDPFSVGKSKIALLGLIRRWLFYKADIIISISPALTKAYKIYGMQIHKLKEVVNPVDINRSYPLNKNDKMNLRKRLGFKQNLTIILCVGIIIKRKGIDLLIKSFAKYINKYSFNATLILIGPNAENEENIQFYNKMKILINDLGIEKNIIFTGIKANVDEYMQISDIFVLLSEKEGLPNVLLEAMSTGLPVIALNIPGITEFIIQNGVDGIIIYEENSDKIALTIDKILSNQNIYNSISINARKTVISRFSTEIIDEQYMQIYNEIN